MSASHGSGTGDLLDKVVERLPFERTKTLTFSTNLAIVGRPNVGESSLLNELLNKERDIVCDAPDSTRDAIEEILEDDGKTYRIIDTSGSRRRNSVERGTEHYAVNRAMLGIRCADVALLMLDVKEGTAEEVRKIGDLVAVEGRACVLPVNTGDLIEIKDVRAACAPRLHLRP